MADQTLVYHICEKGVESWNRSRVDHPQYPQCDIYEEAAWGADLAGANLAGINLKSAILLGANLADANLAGADLSGALLHHANLERANLEGALLDGTILADAKLRDANLRRASLRGASLEWDRRRTYPSRISTDGVDLRGANLCEVDVSAARFDNVRAYGVSIWNLKGEPSLQTEIVISREFESRITVDDLRVAQFVHLLITNANIRNVIDTVAKKAILILGRFTEERKPILDGLRQAFRDLGYIPIVFDFDRPADRDFTETILSLAGMSLFVVADITKPRSVPLELQATVPNFKIPFVPIIQEGENPFAMFRDLSYPWVLDLLVYNDLSTLLQVLNRAIIEPALEKHKELTRVKSSNTVTRKASDYL